MQENWALSSVFMFMDIRGCQDSNGDGLGDLPGLISRLDHFQEVGIGALVFAGLQPSDFSYVGTMMKEFSDVDSRYGSLADFDRLIREARDRDIAVLLGWSPYSTHPDHPCFQASRDPNSPDHAELRDFYVWTEDINARQPRGSGHWQWDPVRREYYHTIWYAADHRWCPQMNPMSPRVRKENEKVIRFWLDRGADGFWVDVGVGGSFFSWEDHTAFSREMTSLVHSYPRKWIISEGNKSVPDTIRDGYDSFLNNWARAPDTEKTAFRAPGKGRFTDFFEGLETQGIHEALLAFYDEPKGNQVMNFFRLNRTVDFDDPEDLARLKLQFLIHGTLPVIPLFSFPHHCGFRKSKPRQFVTPYPFLMMWDNSPNYGFTTGMPCVKQNLEGYPARATVEAQLRDEGSPLSAFKAIMTLRRETPALQCHGPVLETYAMVPSSDDNDCLAYLRRHPESGQCALVVVNLSSDPATYTLHFQRSARLMKLLAGRRRFEKKLGSGPPQWRIPQNGDMEAALPACGYTLLVSHERPPGE